MKLQGTVKFYNKKSGYGFLKVEGRSKDVFVHRTALKAAGYETLAENEVILFEIAQHQGKENAVNIERKSA